MNADPVVKGVLLLLLAASVWSWAVIIDKLWRLGAASRSARGHEARAAAARSPQELLPAEAEARDPAGLVISAGLAESAAALRRSPRPPGSGATGSSARCGSRLNAELRRLETRLPFLATLGSAAPFIGLFGTVWGIMRSFEGIAAANNTSLAVVAPGIAEALFATAMGLAAAIPAVVAYNKITVDLGRFAGRMQGLIGRSGGLIAHTAAGA